MCPVSVLIADDHEIVRRGLRALIHEQSIHESDLLIHKLLGAGARGYILIETIRSARSASSKLCAAPNP